MKCEDCNAYKSMSDKAGMCRANPPQLMVFGMERVNVPGLRTNQVGQRPLTGSGYPETPPDGWCRQFQQGRFNTNFTLGEPKGEVSEIPSAGGTFKEPDGVA